LLHFVPWEEESALSHQLKDRAGLLLLEALECGGFIAEKCFPGHHQYLLAHFILHIFVVGPG
ncbi:MAG: hypothetical protein VX272_08110, partial [Planctomycetota bacterium]|nr:hypothetical protein [Planctomycetota bacterium]